jgi:hypothetical protein
MRPSVANLLLALVSQDPESSADPVPAGFPDWEKLASIASQLRLAPLLTCGLRSKNLLGIVPPPVRQKLVTAAEHNCGHNIACSSLTDRIVELLTKQGIDVMLLKGIAHIHDCYPEPEGRVLRDIDLLVRKNHLAEAARCIQCAGFYQQQSHSTSEGHHHLPPFLSDEGQAIEIHWNLAHPLAPVHIQEEELWKLARPCTAIPGSFLLHPVDSLIHTSVHLMISSDIAGHVYQLIDIDRLIKVHFNSPGIFSRLTDRAVQFGCEIPLSRSLHLAHEFLGTSVPAKVYENLGYSRFTGRIMHYLTTSTIADSSQEESGWQLGIYRNLLNYRKLMLRMSSRPQRMRYALTRPVALLKELIKLLINRIA